VTHIIRNLQLRNPETWLVANFLQTRTLLVCAGGAPLTTGKFMRHAAGPESSGQFLWLASFAKHSSADRISCKPAAFTTVLGVLPKLCFKHHSCDKAFLI
jgi:hypothetical protein